MTQFESLTLEAEPQKTILHVVAVDLKRLGRVADVAPAKGEPVEKKMEFQVIGQKTLLPKSI